MAKIPSKQDFYKQELGKGVLVHFQEVQKVLKSHFS